MFLHGCASTKYYNSSVNKNLLVTTKKDSGSAFSSIDIYLDVYEVNHVCEAKFLGSIKLSDKQNKVGIAVNKNTLLSFRFEGSSFLGGSRSSASFDTLLKPRKGYLYDINARYQRGIYNVEIHEQHANSGKKHRIESRELNKCRK